MLVMRSSRRCDGGMLVANRRQKMSGSAGKAVRYMLNLAADHGFLDSLPRLKLKTESRASQRCAHEEEYRAIVSKMPREHQRVVIAWWETGMRHREVFNLRWPMVDLRSGLLRLPADILKEKSPRRTPISYELRVVLEELKSELSKIANLTAKDGSANR